MSYFKNITVGEMCVWRNEIIRFDPDSSPSAWTHYRTIYEGRIEGYDFSRLSFYIRYSEFGDLNRCFCGERNIWLNYIDLPSPDSRDYNRLFALKNDTVRIEKEGVTYIEPAYRYGGECDFNFNQEKYTDFKAFIGGDAYALDRLEKCRAKHHTLINFSLMQALGNMQGVKGEEDYDRLDVFIHKLNQYFEGSPDEVVCSAGRNREFLEKYLHGFRDIYDYCEKIYFIDNKEFVDEIIRQGALPIAGCRDVIRYMDLADEFWRRKRIKIEEIYRKRGSVKNFVALVKNSSFLVRITDMTILIEKEFIYGSSKRPNPTDYYRKQHYQCG